MQLADIPRHPLTFGPSPIHPFLQLLAHLKIWQLFPRNLNLLPVFGISAGISTIFFKEKGTKTPDFNSSPPFARASAI